MPNIDRRRFLHLAAGAGLAAAVPGVMAGCSGEDEETPPTAAGNSTVPTVAVAKPEDARLRVGYLPITDSTPLLLAHAKNYYQEAGLEVAKPTLFRSWPAIVEAFQARQVDVIHLLMPTAVFMRFGQKFPAKVVAWNHVDGSAMAVANKVNGIGDLAGQTVAIPSFYSLHNITLQLVLRDAGMQPILVGNPTGKQVKLSVMAPSDMPPALANGSIAGFIVAEPFPATAEVNNVGKILRFTGDVWQNHACCVVLMHEDDIQKKPKWAQATVTSLARAQLYARDNRKETAKLLSKEGGDYLPQALPVIERALTYYDRDVYGKSGAIEHADWKNNRIDFQPFPFPSYTDKLVQLMKETSVEGDAAFLGALDASKAHADLVDDRFARAAITAVGGPAKFGLPESLTRSEVVSP